LVESFTTDGKSDGEVVRSRSGASIWGDSAMEEAWRKTVRSLLQNGYRLLESAEEKRNG
jgi:hypothetical protein